MHRPVDTWMSASITRGSQRSRPVREMTVSQTTIAWATDSKPGIMNIDGITFGSNVMVQNGPFWTHRDIRKLGSAPGKSYMDVGP